MDVAFEGPRVVLAREGMVIGKDNYGHWGDSVNGILKVNKKEGTSQNTVISSKCHR